MRGLLPGCSNVRILGLLSGVNQQARQLGSLSRDTRTDKGKPLDIIPIDNESQLLPQGRLGMIPGQVNHHYKRHPMLEGRRSGGTAPSPCAEGVHNSPVLCANTMGLIHWTGPEPLNAEWLFQWLLGFKENFPSSP